MLNLQTASNSTLNWLLQDKEPKCSTASGFSQDVFFNHIRESYSLLHDLKTPLSNIPLQPYKACDYKGTYFNVVVEIECLLKDNADLFKHFLIHGSVSDMSWVNGWSDFDAMAVIRHTALLEKNRQRLLSVSYKLDALMRTVDPLQHHGIHFIHEFELNNFPNLYLPKNILSKAKCLLGSANIGVISSWQSGLLETTRFNAILHTLESASSSGILKHHAKNGQYLLEDFHNEKALYQLKYFLCIIMLLPCYWANLRGVYLDKPEAYQLLYSEIKDFDFEILKAATKIRKEWDINRTDAHSNKIPDWIKNTLGNSYLTRGHSFAKELSKKNVS